MKFLMFVLLCVAFFAVPAFAAEFEGVKQNLPSLVMLSTPT